MQNVVSSRSYDGSGKRYSIVVDVEHIPASLKALEAEIRDFATDSVLAASGKLATRHIRAGSNALTVGLRVSNAIGLGTPQLIWATQLSDRGDQVEHAVFICSPRQVRQKITGVDGQCSAGLYRWYAQSTEAEAYWQYKGVWEEKHGPFPCTAMRSGYPEREHCPRTDKHENITLCAT